MPLMFNPPPTWPPSPAGWSPPPGWQPDPRWGPPPPQWPLWKRANPRAFVRTVVIACAFYAVLALIVLGGAGTPEAGAARAFGYAMGQALVGGSIAGIFPYRSRRPWGWGKYVAVTLGVCLVVALLRAAGARSH